MPAPKRTPRLLWVEGKDDSAVAQSLCAAHDVPELFQVVVKEGVDELLATFFAELRAPMVERFGIVVDANGNAQARWESIRNTLGSEGYRDVPEELATDGMVIPGTLHRPLFGAWIMPDNGSAGALEDFAAALVPAGDPLWAQAAEAIDRIPAEHRRFGETRRPKAQIHTWLAWQEFPGSPMGQAITKGDLSASAPLAEAFVSWLRRLMVSDTPGAAG
jgi:hypothetical protein